MLGGGRGSHSRKSIYMCLQTSVVFWRSSHWNCPKIESVAAERTALSTSVFLLHLRCTGREGKLVLYDIVLWSIVTRTKVYFTLFWSLDTL